MNIYPIKIYQKNSKTLRLGVAHLCEIMYNGVDPIRRRGIKGEQHMKFSNKETAKKLIAFKKAELNSILECELTTRNIEEITEWYNLSNKLAHEISELIQDNEIDENARVSVIWDHAMEIAQARINAKENK